MRYLHELFLNCAYRTTEINLNHFMKDSHIPILVLSFLSLYLIGRFNGPRDWVQALYKHPATSLFLIVVLGSTFLGGSRGEMGIQGSAMVDSVRIVRMIVLITIFFICSYTLLKSTKSLSMAGPGALLMLAYGLYAMLSSAYSPQPFLTLWKGFEVVTMVLAIITVATKIKTISDLEWILNILLAFMLFLVISVLAGAIIDPANAFRNLWEGGNAQDASTATIAMLRGVMPQLSPAAIGGIAGFTAIAAIIRLLTNDKKSRLGFIIVAGLSITTLILIQSRTGIFAISSAIVAILILKRYTLYAVLIGVPAGIVILLTAISDSIKSYIYRGQTDEQFASMSGRMDFWPLVIDKFYESPLIGHGYYASHRSLFGVSGVDNTYLSVALGVGLVGLFFFLSAYYISILTLFKTWPSKQSSYLYKELWVLLVGLSIITFIRSIVGTSFETFYYMLFVYMILQISIFSLARIKKEDHINPNPINDDAPQSEKNEENLTSSKSRRILRRRKDS